MENKLQELAKLLSQPNSAKILMNFNSEPLGTFTEFNIKLVQALIKNPNILPISLPSINPELKNALQSLGKLKENPFQNTELLISIQRLKVRYLSDFVNDEVADLSSKYIKQYFSLQKPSKENEKPSPQDTNSDKTDALLNNASLASIPQPIQELFVKYNQDLERLENEVQKLNSIIQDLRESDSKKTQIYSEVSLKINKQVQIVNESEFFNPKDLIDKEKVKEILKISESTYYRHKHKWICYKVGSKSLYNLDVIMSQIKYFLK
jgi:hypothetical protein